MAHDHAIFATDDEKTPSLHCLHFTVAHSDEIGAEDIGGSLQHPLFLCQRLDVEAWAPRLARLRQNGDGSIHAAGLDAEFENRGCDQVGRAAAQLDVHLGVGLSIDPDMKMKQMRVDRRHHLPSHRVAKHSAIVSGRPDRNAAALATTSIEVGQEAITLSFAALLAVEHRIGPDERVAVRIEAVHLVAGGKDIGCKIRDVSKRPGQQRGDDGFWNTRRPVLPNMTVSSDACRWSAFPRLER